MSNKLIFTSNNNCKISQALKQVSDYVYFDYKEMNKIKSHNMDHSALVINCLDYNNRENEFDDIINFCFENNLPIILLNNDSNPIASKSLELSLPCKCIVVRNYDKYKVFDIWQDTFDNTEVKQPKSVYKSPSCDDKNCSYYNYCKCYSKKTNYILPYKNDYNYNNLACKVCDAIKVKHVLPYNSILNSTSENSSKKSSIFKIDNINNLPKEQYKTIYVNLNFSETIDNNQPQIINNATVLEITLIASYKPPYKYLQLRTLGTGLYPGELICNNKYCRGWFQNTIDVYAHPDNIRLKIYSNEPKNVNNATYYEASSTLSIGVNINKYPGFRPSYDVKTKETTSVYDFSILNNTFSNFARWTWQLAMTENKIWNIFTCNVFRQTTVKTLPPLAVYNLQPVTDTVWYVENGFNEKVSLNVRFTIQYLMARVRGNRFRYTRYIEEIEKSYGTTLSIDFSTVNS